MIFLIRNSRQALDYSRRIRILGILLLFSTLRLAAQNEFKRAHQLVNHIQEILEDSLSRQVEINGNTLLAEKKKDLRATSRGIATDYTYILYNLKEPTTYYYVIVYGGGADRCGIFATKDNRQYSAHVFKGGGSTDDDSDEKALGLAENIWNSFQNPNKPKPIVLSEWQIHKRIVTAIEQKFRENHSYKDVTWRVNNSETAKLKCLNRSTIGRRIADYYQIYIEGPNPVTAKITNFCSKEEGEWRIWILRSETNDWCPIDATILPSGAKYPDDKNIVKVLTKSESIFKKAFPEIFTEEFGKGE